MLFLPVTKPRFTFTSLLLAAWLLLFVTVDGNIGVIIILTHSLMSDGNNEVLYTVAHNKLHLTHHLINTYSDRFVYYAVVKT